LPVSLPDFLSLSRILVLPAVVWLLLSEETVTHNFGYAAVLFVLASLTDLVDGYLARRRSATTVLGAFLDTTADKALVTGGLLGLLAVDRVSVWVCLIIIGRELVVMALRALAAVGQRVMQVSFWGKAKATVQYAAIAAAMLRPGGDMAGLRLDEWLMGVAVVFTVVSGAEYLWGHRDVMRQPEPR